MKIVIDDGGRADAGYKGDAGDCVTRAIAIATQQSYKEVYEAIFAEQRLYANTHRTQLARRMKSKGFSPRGGVARSIYDSYLKSLGWKWQPTMGIGTGCKVHLQEEELPKGKIIARVSKHVVAIIDGVVHDTYDCTRGGTRCVYGYYYKN